MAMIDHKHWFRLDKTRLNDAVTLKIDDIQHKVKLVKISRFRCISVPVSSATAPLTGTQAQHEVDDDDKIDDDEGDDDEVDWQSIWVTENDSNDKKSGLVDDDDIDDD